VRRDRSDPELINCSCMTLHQFSLQSPPQLPDLDEILSRLGDGVSAGDLEGQQLDFKEPARSPKETFKLVADAAVRFANADGGRIVLGVNDKARSRQSAGRRCG
jgi:Putative DNA-binding domain